ncbi:MAG TPA: hypothetical protein DCZ95_10825 [Verrucomicrobia bacterium]|nr:hypothetical protein [Verrucomicrobiota bacterium]
MTLGHFEDGGGLADIFGRGIDHQQAGRRNRFDGFDEFLFQVRVLAAVKKNAGVTSPLKHIGAQAKNGPGRCVQMSVA